VVKDCNNQTTTIIQVKHAKMWHVGRSWVKINFEVLHLTQFLIFFERNRIVECRLFITTLQFLLTIFFPYMLLNSKWSEIFHACSQSLDEILDSKGPQVLQTVGNKGTLPNQPEFNSMVWQNNCHFI